jgi:phage FluMu gp28-like protein
VIKQTVIEDRFQRTPMAFLRYQQRWSADESRVKVYEKSRRIGITWAEAGDDALLAARKNGMDIWYIGYNKEMALEFISDCAAWAKFYSKAAAEIEEFIFEDEKKDILAFRIRFASGFQIVALSSRPANLRGKQGKVVIDEASFHDDLPGLLKAAIALLMWGGRVVVISTHDGDDNPFNELVNDIRAGRKPYSLHRTTIDDALDDGLYERICLRLHKKPTPEGKKAWLKDLLDLYGDDADEELFCIPSMGSGTYLTRNMIEACMSDEIPVLRWSPPEKGFVDWPDGRRYAEVDDWCKEELAPLISVLCVGDRATWFGEDFGRSVDLTVMWPLQDMPGLTYHTPFVLELMNCPFSQQEQILFYLIDRLPHFAGGALDKGGNGAFLAERARQKYGVDNIEEITFSGGWYIENMPPMKACFEDKTTTIPRDNDILDDFRAIKKIKGVPRVPVDERTVSKRGGKRHGDAAIAKCLAVYAARNIEYYRGVPVVITAGPRQTAESLADYHGKINYGGY